MEPFVMLMREMLESAAWNSLTAQSRSVFIALMQQYNGGNNGDLSYTKTTAERLGLSTSGTSIRKAGD